MKRKPEIHGRRRTFLMALVQCRCGGSKHDVCCRGRTSSQTQGILAVREREDRTQSWHFSQCTPVQHRLGVWWQHWDCLRLHQLLPANFLSAFTGQTPCINIKKKKNPFSFLNSSLHLGWRILFQKGYKMYHPYPPTGINVLSQNTPNLDFRMCGPWSKAKYPHICH